MPDSPKPPPPVKVYPPGYSIIDDAGIGKALKPHRGDNWKKRGLRVGKKQPEDTPVMWDWNKEEKE